MFHSCISQRLSYFHRLCAMCFPYTLSYSLYSIYWTLQYCLLSYSHSLSVQCSQSCKHIHSQHGAWHAQLKVVKSLNRALCAHCRLAFFTVLFDCILFSTNIIRVCLLSYRLHITRQFLIPMQFNAQATLSPYNTACFIN